MVLRRRYELPKNNSMKWLFRLFNKWKHEMKENKVLKDRMNSGYSATCYQPYEDK